ncbi:MAG: phosphoribosylaminoimidazolesuccinocarboxamide synthase [Chloroflexota bacterium]
MKALHTTNFDKLKLLRRGKVRDVYATSGDAILIVASDRISAFDVIMDEPVPGKGIILSQISRFWFEKTRSIINNHFITSDVAAYPAECRQYAEDLEGRSMLVRRAETLPIEFVVRGFVAGSGWKEYQRAGTICGIPLPEGLQQYGKLPEPIFTPSTKAEEGHDMNIGYEEYEKTLGKDIASRLRDVAVELYKFGATYLAERGIILADTKFEFGRLPDGEIILIDEALTPDSSRFWLAETYAPGRPQENFDKQALRDYLESVGWSKLPPPPPLPQSVIDLTLDKYKEAYSKICQK